MKRLLSFVFIIAYAFSLACGDISTLDVLLDVQNIDATHFEVTDMTPAAWEKLKYYRESGRVRNQEELRIAQEAFYNRHIDANGISIVGNDATDDVHFINAAKCILIMTAKHPQVREAYKNYFYNIVIGGVNGFDTVPRLMSDANGNLVYDENGNFIWIKVVASEICPGGDYKFHLYRRTHF